MKEKVGQVFSIAKENKPVPGCTISKAIHDGSNSIIYFSLAADTDISAEIFPYHKLILVADMLSKQERISILQKADFIL